jgi:hypothetical protein
MAETLLQGLRKLDGNALAAFLDHELHRHSLKARELMTLRALIELAPDLAAWSGTQAEITARVNSGRTEPISVESIRRGIAGLKKLGLVTTSHINGNQATYVIDWLLLLGDLPATPAPMATVDRPSSCTAAGSSNPRPRQLLIGDAAADAATPVLENAPLPEATAPGHEAAANSATSGLFAYMLTCLGKLLRSAAPSATPPLVATADRGQSPPVEASDRGQVARLTTGDHGQPPPIEATDRGQRPPPGAAVFPRNRNLTAVSRGSPHENGLNKHPSSPPRIGVGLGGGGDGSLDLGSGGIPPERDPQPPRTAAGRGCDRPPLIAGEGTRPRGVGAYDRPFPSGWCLGKGLDQADLARPHKLAEWFEIAVEWRIVTDTQEGERLFWALAHNVWRRRQQHGSGKGFRSPLGAFTAFLTLANLARSTHQQPWWTQLSDGDEAAAMQSLREWHRATDGEAYAVVAQDAPPPAAAEAPVFALPPRTAKRSAARVNELRQSFAQNEAEWRKRQSHEPQPRGKRCRQH